jgi:hypothetical protein
MSGSQRQSGQTSRRDPTLRLGTVTGRGESRFIKVDFDFDSRTVRWRPTAATGAHLRQVTTIHLNDPDLVEDLTRQLSDAHCIVDRVGPRSIRIRSGWPVRDDAAAYELDGYLRVFEALHPGAKAERLV